MLSGIYNNMPVWIQDLLISVYGLKLRKSRFGKKYKKYFKSINLKLDVNSQSQNIIDFLNFSARDVPYYRENTNLEKRKINDLEELILEFPILKKDIIRNNSNKIISDSFHDKFITVSTSGSTGSPLEIKMDSESREINYAFFHKFLEEIGLSEFRRSATFAGRIMVPLRQKGKPYWRKNKAMNTLLLSSYHLSSDTYLDYINAIEEWAPLYIDSYPSAIYELASLLDNNGYKPKINIKAIITSSETLFDYQRYMIENVFNCPVYDYYGCAEQSVLAFQTPSSESDYLIPAQYCLVEVLSDDLSPVKVGESGKIICTNIFNKAAPIIRYDIGDNAIVSEYFPGSRFVRSLKVIEGRSDDVILTKSGNKIGRLDPVFKGMEGIKETQIIQESLTELKIKIVSIDNQLIDEEKLKRMIELRVGTEMEISISYVENIPRTKSGKFRSVVSKIKV